MCKCNNIEIGSYENQTVLDYPEWFKSEKEILSCGIDNCLVDEIKDLWSQGIQTIESCCGHNKVQGYISVLEDHAHLMVDLGYKLYKSNFRNESGWDENGFRVDTYKPKSLTPQPAPSKPDLRQQITSFINEVSPDTEAGVKEHLIKSKLYWAVVSMMETFVEPIQKELVNFKEAIKEYPLELQTAEMKKALVKSELERDKLQKEVETLQNLIKRIENMKKPFTVIDELATQSHNEKLSKEQFIDYLKELVSEAKVQISGLEEEIEED